MGKGCVSTWSFIDLEVRRLMSQAKIDNPAIDNPAPMLIDLAQELPERKTRMPIDLQLGQKIPPRSKSGSVPPSPWDLVGLRVSVSRRAE